MCDLRTNRYSLLAVTSSILASILAILAISVALQPVNIPPNLDQKVPSPEELGFHENGPAPYLFDFRTVFDPTYMIKTECPQWDGRAVRLRPNTTVPIKASIVSKVGYELDVTFTATLKPLEGDIPGVTFFFDDPSIRLQPRQARDVTLFLSASEDVDDYTTIIVFHVSALAVPDRRYGIDQQGDVLYVMIGDQPDEPQMFVLYPSVIVNGILLYEAGQEPPDHLFLNIKRGEPLNITIPVFVKSNATYSVNITATNPYLLPDFGVTAITTPSWVIARAGDTIEFTITVNVSKDFVGLPEDEWSADEPMHGQDLYMLIQLLDVPHDANAGWCKFVNLPFGIGADYVFFNVGA